MERSLALHGSSRTLFDKVNVNKLSLRTIAGWSSLVARRAHNPKVRGSNPLPATKAGEGFAGMQALFLLNKANL